MYAYYNTKTWADKKVYVEMVRETVESAISNALDAKKAWLEAALEEGVEINEERASVWISIACIFFPETMRYIWNKH